MEAYKEEALKAKENAEKRFYMRDYVGAKDYATKAQMLYPNLEGISQMLTTFSVHLASEIKVNGEPDCYSVLGVDPSAGKVRAKKQYRKLSALLHPDKNKTLGAGVAFKLVSDAWLLLSDLKKRRKFDRKRKKQMSLGLIQGNLSLTSASHGLDTFWTVCTSCRVQYEYLRKYLNKKLSCKNCRGVFFAVETGRGPVNGAFPFSTWSNMPSNVYNEVESNVTIQWGDVTGAVLTTNPKVNGMHRIKNGTSVVSNILIGYSESSASKGARPYKKRKLERVNEKSVMKTNLESETVDSGLVPKPEARSEILTRHYSYAPPFDARTLLIEKAKAEIQEKLKEMEINSSGKRAKIQDGVILKTGTLRRQSLTRHRLELKRTSSMPITVPDSDFHDFDKDRSEDCFRPKQIWAIYDEEDGMPRLYCIIREVISIKPFKIQISYLNAKTDSEFGPVKWVVFGFTKSCGSFRAFNSDVVEEVNLFSHPLEREKAGRGGCVRIYPRTGDIWAVYRISSPDWNKKTPEEVRHQYEMVEILDDYSEELGICVAPLVKLDGYKTVYKRIDNKDDVRWIPRREVLRFSHQVPSWPLKSDDFPDGCWNLDPAAIPDELLQVYSEIKIEDKSCQAEN